MTDRTKALQLSWLFKMAWRDSRRNRSRLLLFVSSIVLGIAALVAIYSLADNLERDIDQQAAGLLGADLVVSGNKKPDSRLLAYLDSIGDDRSRELRFASMAYFPKGGGTRIVQIRALEGKYPYYGTLEASPSAAAQTFRKGQDALVDRTLMLQFNASIGDSVKLGELSFRIAGILEKAPGQSVLAAAVAPVVYIPYTYVAQTGLLQKGSRINYLYSFKFNQPAEVDRTLKQLSPRLEKAGLDYDTVASQKRDTGRSFEDLTQFLALVGFIALLLGCIGVASSIHIYIREKIGTIAILRCLGLKGSQAFLIYLIQIAGIGLLSSVMGAILGSCVQQFLPLVLGDLLPVTLSSALSWTAIGQGIALGLIISVLFALLSLISIRKISPLNTLRVVQDRVVKDPLKWLVYALLLLFIAGFSYLELNNLKQALYFTGAVLLAFAILSATAALLVRTIRRYFPSSWNYLWRQGLANLFRPHNQTLILIVSIGLGTAFIGTLLMVQDLLLKRVVLSSSGNQPNMILFDIQPDQKDKLALLTRQNHLPVIQQVPIVTMRIEEINGQNALDVRKDSTLGISPRAFNSELRATFRDSLSSSERITRGEWRGKVTGSDPVYVSLEERYADRIHVDIGDKIVFNVQGALIPAVVGSLREVDWNRIQTNFRVVFPVGVLESAPQFHVIITRVPNSTASARFQRMVVERFPNVSIIDLDLVLSVLDEILEKIGFVIRFMAAFSIITGIVVLISSILISKFQRIQESVLLRTLGGSRKQIYIIAATEYFLLGSIAAITGLLISAGASWAMAKWLFKTAFSPDVLPLLLLFLGVSMLTVLIGLLNSRGILNKAPLEILRRE